ncbi:TPA: zinc-binding dehydrogenase [Escherichia coli]|nr:zinc-binding dehydrogenase [Escherichia coli]
MKKLVATAPRVAALVEYEDRAISANEVKIRVRFGAPKHGTEVVDFRAASPFINDDFNGEWQMFTPRPADAPRGIEFGKFQLGNMVVGDIIECGSDVNDYAVGDSVCGYGPLSETVIINAVNNYKLRKMPQGSSWKNAVCYDPAQFAMSGVRDANVRVGDFVVVVGLGAIGQIAIQLAKRAGASVVIGVDPITRRCDIARRHGADFCLNPIGADVGKEIKTLTGKQGADVIIETSGYADALQSALRGLAYGGTISYVAFAKPFAEGFNLGREAHFNNAKIVFSRACSEPNPDYPRWSRKRIEETCWELLMNGYLNCEDLIDPVVTFANSPESYMQYVDQHPEQSIKINTLADARRYIVENDLKHVQIIGDFYHMNIEEDNLAQALHDNRDLLGHVHIADNHRYQPGSGTLDFHALFEQLRADNYQGYVVYEGRIRAEDPAQAYRDSLAWVRTC